MTNEDVSSISAHFSRAGRVADYSDTVLPFNEARRGLVRRAVLDHLRPGNRVLEIGCGIGTLTAELIAAGMTCTAIDFSAEMIKRAKSLIGTAAEIEQTDLFEYAITATSPAFWAISPSLPSRMGSPLLSIETRFSICLR